MAPIHPSATGRRAEGGFTLTELLVVLAILALIVAAVPVLVQSALPGVRAMAASRTLANDLRAVRGRAIASGEVADVRFDATRQSYRIEPGGAAHMLPRGIRLSPTLRPSVIAFYPDGSSTGGMVSMGDGRNTHRISVSPLTGRVAIDE